MSALTRIVAACHAREVSFVDGAIRIRGEVRPGQTSRSWTTADIALPVDESSGTGQPPTIHGAVSTDWNTEVLVENAPGVELWRISPSRLRRRDLVWFAPRARLWGIREVEANASGFQFLARNGIRYSLAIDPALGGPLGSVPLTRGPSGRAIYLEPSVPAERDFCDYDVFVSYKHAETSAEAQQAVRALRERQVSVWFDADISAGTFKNHIISAVQQSAAYLTFRSKGSRHDTDEAVDLQWDGYRRSFLKVNQNWEHGLISHALENAGDARFEAIYQFDPTMPLPKTSQHVYAHDRPLSDVVDDIVVELNQRRAANRARHGSW